MRLDTLRSLPGVRACALVGEDGLPLEMQGELGDVLAAELAALRASSERVERVPARSRQAPTNAAHQATSSERISG